MRQHLIAFFLCATFAVAPTPTSLVLAQEAATLIADSLEIAGDNTLIADGSVEVFHQGRRMTASRIVYDQATDRLRIDGPIRLIDETGSTVIVAAQADLASDLTEGLMHSARIVLQEQLQISAAELRRSDGRYMQLDNTVASSCRICDADSAPLWEIRARRVLHDTQEKQIYFDHAQVRVGGLPVFYLPRLRMPDPSLERSTGFLQPTLVIRTDLGTGLTFPYFVTLGPSRDLTFSPTLTTTGAFTLGLRYRQAYDNGAITLQGAISRDDLQPGQTRGYAMADGSFLLSNGYRLSFHAETVSDDAYLADYNISGADRLTNTLQLDKVTRETYFAGRLINFQSLRAGELGSATPYLLTDATYLRRFSLGPLGGEGMFRVAGHTHTRQSSVTTDSPDDADDVAEGADLGRLSVGADWRRDWITTGGLVVAALGEARIDAYQVQDDARYGGSTSRSFGAAAVELRWPWVRAGATTQEVIEPIAQIVWSDSSGGLIPNEDSRLVEFDASNLFSLNRFPGSDAVETGTRLALGMSWTRIAEEGWSYGVTAGRVFRDTPVATFGAASGLSGTTSDWMIGATIDSPGGLQVAGRVITSSSLDVTRGEIHASLSKSRYSISAGYINSIADPVEARVDRVSDIVLSGSYKFTPQWSGTASGRYDFVDDGYSRVDMGLTYRNECASFDLSLSRRLTTSTNLQPSTTIDVSFGLIGFGAGSSGAARQCRR